MSWKRCILLALVCAAPCLVMAQEEVVTLGQTSAHVKKSATPSSSRINVMKHPFIYVIDTLSLPFFDDFSTYRVKEYDAQYDDPSVSLKIDYDFEVNGNHPIRLDYMTDTTYSVYKHTNGDVDEVPNPTLFITLFEGGEPVAFDTGWTNVITEFNQGTGLVTFDTLVPQRSLVNTPDTFYRVEDDNTLWTWPIDTFDSLRSIPFINNRYAKNMLTQGVATFDGTNAKGYPYDISGTTTYGLADVLTSKPIALDSNMENVFLSFFYQAGGHGNMPDEEDSLVVEFFDVVDSTWRFAHKVVSPQVEDSNWTDQVFIPIDGRKYLQHGFRFRFKNYATLSASFDHWHVDYIRLDKDRDTLADDSVIRDVAFTRGIEDFLQPYRSVPYTHYLQDPAAFESEAATMQTVNLGLETVILLGLRYEVFDPSGNLVNSAITTEPQIDPRTRQTNIFPLQDSPLFPDLGTTEADFMIRSRYTSTGQDNTYYINDTIFTEQRFRDYYAYDDGTAEKAYGLTGAGLELAYEFNAPVGDSLRAIYFNFPQVLHNDNDDLPIKILVWTDLASNPIYEAEQWVDPAYTDANAFFRINLDKPVFVDGRFYIGFQQQEAKKIYIGFDANSDAKRFTYYRIGEDWYNSSFKGALMIRPSFSKKNLAALNPMVQRNSPVLHTYPNPAADLLRIVTDRKLASLQLLDIHGRMVRGFGGASAEVNVGDLPNGLYILRGVTERGNVLTTKLIIQH